MFSCRNWGFNASFKERFNSCKTSCYKGCAYAIKGGIYVGKRVLAASKVLASGLQPVFAQQAFFCYVFQDEIASSPANIAFTCSAMLVNSVMAGFSRVPMMVADENKPEENEPAELPGYKKYVHKALTVFGFSSGLFSALAVYTGGNALLDAFIPDAPTNVKIGPYIVIGLCVSGTFYSFMKYNFKSKIRYSREILEKNIWQSLKSVGLKKITAICLFSLPGLTLSVSYGLFSSEQTKAAFEKTFGLKCNILCDILVNYSVLTQFSLTMLTNLPSTYEYLFGENSHIYFTERDKNEILDKINHRELTFNKPTFVFFTEKNFPYDLYYYVPTKNDSKPSDCIQDDDKHNKLMLIWRGLSQKDNLDTTRPLTNQEQKYISSIIKPNTNRTRFLKGLAGLNCFYNACGSFQSFVDKSPTFFKFMSNNHWTPSPYDWKLIALGILFGSISSFNDFTFSVYKAFLNKEISLRPPDSVPDRTVSRSALPPILESPSEIIDSRPRGWSQMASIEKKFDSDGSGQNAQRQPQQTVRIFSAINNDHRRKNGDTKSDPSTPLLISIRRQG